MITADDQLTFVGYIPYSDGVSFGIPIFKCRTNSLLYTQVRDGNRICHLMPISVDSKCIVYPDDLTSDEIKPSRSVIIFRLTSRTIIGNIDNVSGDLGSALDQVQDIATKLQLADILEMSEVRNQIAESLLANSRFFGASKAGLRSLRRTMEFDNLWRLLSENAERAGQIERLIPLRRLIAQKFSLETGRLLPDPIHSELADIVKADLRVIQLAARIADINLHLTTSDISSADREIPSRINQLLNLVRKPSRQEFRVALLMKIILQHGDVGLDVLRLYNPDKGFERVAKEYLIDGYYLANVFRSENEAKMLEVIKACYRRAYLNSRARFLVALSKELSSYMSIRAYVLNTISRSKSILLDPYRSQIIVNLQKRQ